MLPYVLQEISNKEILLMDMITLRLPHKPRQLYVTIKKTIAATFQDAFLYPATQNMNTYVRWELFIIGCVFLGIPMYMDVHLHWLMLLPLMSIYLIHSAITGYEPIYDALKRVDKLLHRHWVHHNPAPTP